MMCTKIEDFDIMFYLIKEIEINDDWKYSANLKTKCLSTDKEQGEMLLKVPRKYIVLELP